MTHIVLRVLKDKTLVVERRLLDAGFNCYCPRIIEMRLNRHHKLGGLFKSVVPMFPGYLFLRRPDQPRSMMIPGVRVAPLAIDGKYLQLTDADLERVRSFELEINASPLVDSVNHRPPSDGDTIVILRGVLVKSRAVVVSVRNHRLALVRLLGSDNGTLFVNMRDVARVP